MPKRKELFKNGRFVSCGEVHRLIARHHTTSSDKVDGRSKT